MLSELYNISLLLEKATPFLRSFVLILAGIPAVYFLSKWGRHTITRRFTPQQGMIAGKILFYSGMGLLVVLIFQQLGFTLTPLLGAAGIVGIAVGFASQTSVSNVISGLFLIAEKPFIVNDVINVGDVTGQVLSIDTLSIKIRTFDNRFVRIPNETIIKSQVTNITRFPIRRVDINVGVAYKEDIGRVRNILLDIVHQIPLCLEEPEPLVIFSGYGNSSIDMLLVAWVVKTDWLKVKNILMEEIKKRFDQEGIEIPFPHLSLYTGTVTEPFPVQIIPPASAGVSPAQPEQGEGI